MNCESAKDLMWLVECGELSLDDEELLEQHIAACPSCAAERQRMQRIDALLQTQRMDVSPQLLARCRRDLSQKVGAERMPSGAARWLALWQSAWNSAWLRPAGAMALVALGFFGGRAFTPATRVPVFVASNSTPSGLTPVTQPGALHEESAALDNASYEEPRAHVAAGAYANDARLRGVLLAAVSAQDPALRLDSIELLRRHCEDAAVRQALLGALRNDRSSGVRLKALEALKPYARDTETRSVLAQVLLTDNNPAVRTQAIELLTQSHSPDVAAALQEVLRHEENGYIRERSVTALRAMKASTGTF